MSKRKNDNVAQIHPQKSFQDYVADATLAKFGGYIREQVQQLSQALSQRQEQTIQNLFIRLVALEEIIMENNSTVTKDVLADRVAAVQDRNEGFDPITGDGQVEAGDRVRLEIKTKTADQTDYQGASRLLIDNAGSGNTLGQELEGSLIGMKTSEVREVKFGKDESLTASIAVNKISRQAKQEVAEAEGADVTEANETLEQAEERVVQAVAEAPVPQEALSASINAG